MRASMACAHVVAALSVGADDQLVKNPSTVPLTTASFFQFEEYRDALISPSGNHVAAIARVENKYSLVVMSQLDRNPPVVTAKLGIQGRRLLDRELT